MMARKLCTCGGPTRKRNSNPKELLTRKPRSSIDINPDDEVQLLVWKGLKTKGRQRVYLLTDTIVPTELGPDLDKLNIDIWFTSKEGQLNRKPFRYQIDTSSWNNLGLSEVNV